MNTTRYYRNGARLPFNNFVNHFFSDLPSIIRDDAQPATLSVPVNIRKTEYGYVLELAAPGRQKEDFRISIDKNLLTIATEVKEEAKDENLVRQEFKVASFSRTFTLDKSLEIEKIEARYVNGLLTLTLPKKAEVKEPVKQITIQ